MCLGTFVRLARSLATIFIFARVYSLRHAVPFFNRKFHRNFLLKKSGTSSRKCRTLFFRQLIFRFTAKLYRISFIRFISSLLVNLRLLCFAVLEEVFRYSREQSVG